MWDEEFDKRSESDEDGFGGWAEFGEGQGKSEELPTKDGMKYTKEELMMESDDDGFGDFDGNIQPSASDM
jgi:hypothetical protein